MKHLSNPSNLSTSRYPIKDRHHVPGNTNGGNRCELLSAEHNGSRTTFVVQSVCAALTTTEGDPVKIFCPRCQTDRAVRCHPDDTHAPCPACGIQITLTRSEQPLGERLRQPITPEIVEPEASAPVQPTAVVPYPHQQTRQKRGLPLGLMIAGGICLLLMITVGALAAVWLTQPDGNETIASSGTTGTDDNESDPSTSPQDDPETPDSSEPPSSTTPSSGNGSTPSTTGTMTLPDLIERVRPSLVHISVKGIVLNEEDGKLYRGSWSGSGFVVNEDGTIVTNHHVVEDGKTATATLSDGTQLKVLGYSFASDAKDIAILKLEDGLEEFQALDFAPQLPRAGADVFAMGSPRGFTGSATKGVVSAIRTSGELQEMDILGKEGKWVQTDTPISKGNSGGPLLNMQGQVVGANTWGLKVGQNLNFAISAEDIKQAVQSASSTTQEISGIVSSNVARALRAQGIR